MKKIIFALAVLAVVSCKKEPVDYTLITGKITNSTSTKLTINNNKREVVKEITVAENGVFSDTLRLDEGRYSITDGNEYATIYVKKGTHFNMTLDTKKFDETLKFTGTGADANTYFAKTTMLQDELDFDGLMSGDQTNFDSNFAAFKNLNIDLLKSAKGLDSITIVQQTKGIEDMEVQLKSMYAAKVKMKEMVGKPSASFNFDNHKGGKTDLASLKGKYIYIDVWATWCAPCKKEIPALQALEKEYHGKNIEFVSISVDQNKEAWTKMVADKKLGGIQLHYGGDRSFSEAFAINGIPRFIMLDPNGNVVDADAPRPSSEEIKKLFTAQGI